ncbi:hypothetical protein F5144DRAFT_525766 [Chaetomium tenue]|uniref:Uncharacterized protein n=1 Tax=Chaetomium tenue TaxID=1854479 RepID=A0ACB7PEF4_9PEZI|nr:hypothetical protein F5144DRAFT_525766 [Chaetomium globosum]
MDPTSPEFRPKFQPEPESSQSTNHRPPAGNSNDPQWRTKCRTCGEAFKSRNQLMRHLYRSHPLKPGKSKASGKTAKSSLPQPPPQSLPRPPLPAPHPAAPKREQPQVHPFALLAHQDQLAFVGQAMRAVFAVGMKQLEEEQAQQRDGNHEHISAASQNGTALPTSNPSSPLGPCAGKGPAIAPTHTYQGQQGDDSGSEDSDDDEDGGAALYGPGLEEPPLRLGDTGRGELNGLDSIDDLD